jgi:hypothetical protein
MGLLSTQSIQRMDDQCVSDTIAHGFTQERKMRALKELHPRVYIPKYLGDFPVMLQGEGPALLFLGIKAVVIFLPTAADSAVNQCSRSAPESRKIVNGHVFSC